MFWDHEYASNKRLWGEQPSELAVAAVAYLKKYRANDETIDLLDIGCGYGRDALYFLDNLACTILAIDMSEKAVSMAAGAALEKQKEGVDFRCCSFTELGEQRHDVVFLSNFYQILERDERTQLRQVVRRTLRTDGLLFMSTLSINDPEHRGKGSPIPDEPNSFRDKVYLHLCSGEELTEDFDFLRINALYEHEYDEPRATGETHHHISWILIGQNVTASSGPT